MTAIACGNRELAFVSVDHPSGSIWCRAYLDGVFVEHAHTAKAGPKGHVWVYDLAHPGGFDRLVRREGNVRIELTDDAPERWVRERRADGL